jgi:branched-chain amino acid transport system permease protein
MRSCFARARQLKANVRLSVGLLLVACLLSGCSALFHGDAVRLCRSLTPVFNGQTDRIVMRRTDASRTIHGLVVVVAYTAATPQGSADRRAISCVFREDGPAGRLELTNLATEEGPVGEVRLHFIKRHWVDGGHAAINDPSPVALAPFVPEVPTALAHALQALLGGAGGIAIYTLLAAAYALVYGLIGRINLAFGELAMLAGYGAFLGYWVGGGAAGVFAVMVAAVLGIATAVVHGAASGQWLFERLAPRPGQHILIATLGLSIAWSEAVRLVQGSGQRWVSPLSAGPIAVARADEVMVTVTVMGVIVPVVAALALWAARYGLRKTAFGRAWRACSDDPLAAALCGISANRVQAWTIAGSSLLAGIAGVLILLFYGGVGHAGGLVIGLKALIAAVIGGIGSVRAAVLGALTIGLAEVAWSHLVSIDSRDLAIFSALAIVLVLRPEGLFQERA